MFPSHLTTIQLSVVVRLSALFVLSLNHTLECLVLDLEAKLRKRTHMPVATVNPFQTSPGFYLSAVQAFWKHCGKRRNCRIDQDQSTQNVQSDLWSTLSTISLYIITKSFLHLAMEVFLFLFSQWKTTIYSFGSERVNNPVFVVKEKNRYLFAKLQKKKLHTMKGIF